MDPKLYYRRMDDLLTQITVQRDGKSFLPDILSAFEAAFGEELHLTSGRLFEQREETYVPVAGPPADALAALNPIVSLTVAHGSYIFDQYEDPNGAYSVPAAFDVRRGPGRHWLFVYELTPGWRREELTFAMNAVRFALNGRLRQEAVASDIAQAAEIQLSLLPEGMPEFAGYEFAARSTPAEDVGGDFYDFLDLDDDILGISIGDASGHGLPAALLVRDVMTGIRMGMESHMKLIHTLKRLNRVVHRSTYSSRFVSVFYGELERNGNLLFANAGHISPLLFSGDTVTTLEPTGMILGPIPEIRLERSYVHMQPDDLLLLFTDGIVERFNASQEMFDTAGLRRVVKAHRGAPVDELVDAIYEAARQFGMNRRLDDDATVVAIRRLKTA